MCVSQEVLRTVYFGFIESHLSYSILTWGHSAAVRGREFRLQRRAVRIVAKLSYRAPCQDAYKTLRILTFPCLYILNCLLHAKSNLAHYVRHSDIHSYNTRPRNEFRADSLRLTKSRTGPNSLFKFINKLSANIIEMPAQSFKTHVN